MAKSFKAQLEEFEKLTLSNLRYVAAESIQDVVEAAQTPQLAISKGATSFVEGKIPVAEGDLINSLTSEGNTGADSYVAAISGYDVGDNMSFAWTMEYAMRIELGFKGTDDAGRTFNQEGRHFVGANARRFPDFVEERVREVKR